jgi:hypothetical protein
MVEIEDEELAEQMKMMERMKMLQQYSNSPADGISWGLEKCVLLNGEQATVFRIDVVIDGFRESYTARIDQLMARQLIKSLQEYINAGNQVEGYA